MSRRLLSKVTSDIFQTVVGNLDSPTKDDVQAMIDARFDDSIRFS